MASYRFLDQHQDQVRDSSCSTSIRHGFSKSQMCLHKILRIIASYAPPLPPPPQRETTSKQGSSSTPCQVVEFREERDLCGGNRGIGIDLNMEFSPCWLDGEENNEAPSAGSVVENKVFGNIECPAVAEFTGGSAVEKSSEGECDPNNKDGDGHSPTTQAVDHEESRSLEVSVSETTNLQTHSHEININGIDDESHDKEEEEEAREVKNEGRHGHDEEDRVLEAVACGEEEEEKNKSSSSDHSLTILIEAAQMVSGNSEDNESSSDSDEKPTTTVEIEEEQSPSPSPSLSGGRRGSKRRNNKCWVVDLYRELDNDMTTTTPVAKSKRGRSQVLPSRYRDSSMVLEPWKRLPRRRPSHEKPAAAAAAVVSTKRKSR